MGLGDNRSMATIVNNPAPSSSDNSGIGSLVAALLVMGVVALLFYFLVPILRQSSQTGGPQINVPDKVDVNVNTPQ